MLLCVLEFLLLLNFLTSDLCGAEQPGITVIVVDTHDKPVIETDIEIRDSHDRIVSKGIVRAGRFEILDLGFGPHSIIVQKGRCGEVELKNIFFYMDSHPTFRIVANDCPHSGAQAGSGCIAIFRVRNEHDDRITGAVIEARRTQQKVATDSYGRGTAVIGEGQFEVFTIEASGYRPQRLSLECKMFGDINKEIVLSSVGHTP
jgi:hypothetical protein